MGAIATGNSLWHLVSQSDAMTWFVLGLLLVMSITCWTIFIYKILVLRTRCEQLKDAISHLKSAKNLEDVLHTASKFSNTLAGYLLSKSLSALKSLLMTERGGKTELDDREWDVLMYNLDQILDTVVEREQAYLQFLPVAASLATLMGLFGTIWGLMNAFAEIGVHQAADLSVIAPGMAEALVATLAGLMVAIPAVAMYNFLTGKLRSIERQCTILTDRFIVLSEKLFNSYPEQE